MLDFRNRILIEKAARDAGFEIPVVVDDNETRFRSSLVGGELLIGVLPQGYRVDVQDPAVMHELTAHFVRQRAGYELSDGAIIAKDTLALQEIAERIFQLSMSLPSKPLDLFHAQTGRLPATTEVERLIIQRVGQNIFRDALDCYWVGRCAVTGITDRPLLRASHILAWSDCKTDQQRLDVYNGILLCAHLDAAFDAALMSFDESGRPLFSQRLSQEARHVLVGSVGDRQIALTDRHQVYLQFHRARFDNPAIKPVD